MSIQEHLNKIRNAVYGHEVRESIAKGIETAYDDASEKDNANMEVKIARGTHPNLRSRLEEVDNKQQQNTAQLQQTASKDELQQVSLSYKESYATLTALQTAYPTGNIYNHVVLADGMIYTYKNGWVNTGIQANGTGLANGSVTPIKLNDEVKKRIAESLDERILSHAEIGGQDGQTPIYTYNSGELILQSNTHTNAILTFGKESFDEIEFIIGDSASAVSAFIPIIAIQKDARNEGVDVTGYLTIRDINNTFVLKETFFKKTDSSQIGNYDRKTVANTSGLHFTAGSKVKITLYDNIASVYINGVIAVSMDISDYNTNYLNQFGVWVAGFSGALPKKVVSNVVLSRSNIKALKRSIEEMTDGGGGGGTTVNPFKKNRMFHFSFDDVILAFQDITTKASVYNSAFENPFFGYLKTLNNIYGATFSLYCFYTDSTVGDFTLSDCTNKFAGEFTANSEWLRFGFHCLNGNTNYASATSAKAAEDYALVITQLVRITGSVDCIDRLPRLQNYAGNLDSVKAMRDSQSGIVGLMTSSDVRQNYYLSTEQNDYIYTHDKLYDPNSFLTFVKTTTFMSDMNKFKTLSGANKRDIVSVFLHEIQLSTGYKQELESELAWAKNNGYFFGFPMDIV